MSRASTALIGPFGSFGADSCPELGPRGSLGSFWDGFWYRFQPHSGLGTDSDWGGFVALLGRILDRILGRSLGRILGMILVVIVYRILARILEGFWG